MCVNAASVCQLTFIYVNATRVPVYSLCISVRRVYQFNVCVSPCLSVSAAFVC
jgi:hypothetical protein